MNHHFPIWPILVRLIIPVLLVVAVALTLMTDLGSPPLIWGLCQAGFCREDQSSLNLSYIRLDAANCYKWADYAEFLDAGGKTEQARHAFDRALILGPAIAPVLMRALNFHLAHGDSNEVLKLGRRILELTPQYNELIFTDITGSSVSDITQHGIPPVAAKAWLAWVQIHRSVPEVLEVWNWMQNSNLADSISAASLTTALCNRKQYQIAATLWADWLHQIEAQEYYFVKNLISNPRFSHPPYKSPLDWGLETRAGVEAVQKSGLDIIFAGVENVSYANVRQLSFVSPGAYVFSADVEGVGITTSEGPFFHLFDPDHPGKLGVFTEQIRGTVPRRTVVVRFTVLPGTSAVVTQLERRPSEKLDNKIAGRLHIYEVTLRREN